VAAELSDLDAWCVASPWIAVETAVDAAEWYEEMALDIAL
jgi:hypothetical protein